MFASLTVSVAGLLAPLSVAATPPELLRLMPTEPNALVVLDATAIRQAASGTPPVMRDVPDWVGRYVAGIDLLLGGPLEKSRAAVIELPAGRSLRSTGLLPDQFERIGGVPASIDNRGATLLELAPGLAGVLRPSSPDAAEAWVKSLTTPRLGAGSAFLRKASGEAAELILAVDLNSAFAPEALEAFINAQESLRDRGLSEAATSLQGLSLTMRSGDILAIGPDTTAPAILRAAFPEEPTAEPDAIRDFLASILAELHLAMPELERAEVRRDGRDVLMTLPIGADALERIASLAMPAGYQPMQPEEPAVKPTAPPTEQAANAPAAAASDPLGIESSLPPAPKAGPDVVAAATRQYLADLIDILDRFERAAESSRPENRTAAWIGRFTNQMTRLDERNVDRQALAYGREAEDTMRKLTASLKGQKLSVTTAEKRLVHRYEYEPIYAPYNY